MNPNLYRRIGVSITMRAALLAELGEKLARYDEADRVLEAQFLEVVPEELRKWIDNQAILSNLFRYGRASDKIYCNHHFGFGDFEDTVKKLKQLRTAWRNAVSIEWDDHPESGQVEVTFGALMI